MSNIFPILIEVISIYNKFSKNIYILPVNFSFNENIDMLIDPFEKRIKSIYYKNDIFNLKFNFRFFHS